MSSKPRIEIIDALRGFSLAGIVLVHIVEQYAGAPLPEEATAGARLGMPDYIVDGIIQIFIRGKFFALFSILFGLSFFIQFDNAEKKGTAYRWRYLWRIFLLFVIGYAHHCLYRGDILTIYALLAPLLILFLPLSNRWLLIAFGIVFLGIPRVIIHLLIGDQSVFGGEPLMPGSPVIDAYWTTLQTGSFGEVVQSNATEGFKMKMEFQLGIFYRFYMTFAFFLLGMWLGRIRFFERVEEFKTYHKKVLIWTGLAFVLFVAGTAISFGSMGEGFSLGNPMAIVGLHFADLVNLAITVVLLILFIKAYQTDLGYKSLKIFIPYGRTALTNYVLQSVVGTFILFGWGLGYIGEWRNIYLFGLGIAIIGFQLWLSKWWMSKFRFGPLEWVWRSFTYFRRM